MGAKLGRSKSLPISEKVNGQGYEVITGTSEAHIDGTASTGTKNKKKKKRPKLSNQKSWDSKIDKFTSTEGNTNSSNYIKQLVNGSASNRPSYDARTSLSNYSATPSKDVLELREACIRRGIISSEMPVIVTPAPIEQENLVEESTNETVAVVTNDEEVQLES